jgi:hypothetical protein
MRRKVKGEMIFVIPARQESDYGLKQWISYKTKNMEETR